MSPDTAPGAALLSGWSPASTADLPPVVEATLMPRGFQAGAWTCGIKASGRSDLAVVTTTAGPAAAAAAFTSNLVQAAPVRLSRAHLAATAAGAAAGVATGRASGIVVTSGCANAATGPAGDADQAQVAAALATALGRPVTEILCASTGLIGTRLPVPLVRTGIAALVPDALRADEAGLAAAAEAILTTDSRSKTAGLGLDLPAAGGRGNVTVTVSGFAKGVGMIHPRLATMIAVVLTDATVAPPLLGRLLHATVSLTFNQLTVDGDTSTNDTVFVLASGAAGAAPVAGGSAAARRLRAAITAVCRSLARQQAADGEGATTLLTARVRGAASDAEARAVARAVVGSSLVKAAVHGRDPNWGRIVSAAGNARRADGSAVRLRAERLAVTLCGTRVFAGEPLAFDAATLRRRMSAPEVLVDLDLGLGGGSGEAWGCDLSETYVRENAEYST